MSYNFPPCLPSEFRSSGPCFVTRSKEKRNGYYTIVPTQSEEVIQDISVKFIESENSKEFFIMILLYNEVGQEILPFNPVMFKNALLRLYDHDVFPNPTIRHVLDSLRFGLTAAKYLREASPYGSRDFLHAYRMYSYVPVTPPSLHNKTNFHYEMMAITQSVATDVSEGFATLTSQPLFHACVARENSSMHIQHSRFYPDFHGNIPCTLEDVNVDTDHLYFLSDYISKVETQAAYSRLLFSKRRIKSLEPSDKI